MARYHVSKDGRPRKCTAQSPESCPRAEKDENGKVINHFDSESVANSYGEKISRRSRSGALRKKVLDLDSIAEHAPADAPEDPAMRTALGAAAMAGCTLEKQEDGSYKITDVHNDDLRGLVSNGGTFVHGAELNDDGSVSIGITMNGCIPHWGAEGGHPSWGGGSVDLTANVALRLEKNGDGEYELRANNDKNIVDRIDYDPSDTVNDFKYGVNDAPLYEDDDEDEWIDANSAAIYENLADSSDADYDYYFGHGTSEWIHRYSGGRTSISKKTLNSVEKQRRLEKDLAKRSVQIRAIAGNHYLDSVPSEEDIRKIYSIAKGRSEEMGNVIAKLPKNSNTPEDVLVDIINSPSTSSNIRFEAEENLKRRQASNK